MQRPFPAAENYFFSVPVAAPVGCESAHQARGCEQMRGLGARASCRVSPGMQHCLQRDYSHGGTPGEGTLSSGKVVWDCAACHWQSPGPRTLPVSDGAWPHHDADMGNQPALDSDHSVGYGRLAKRPNLRPGQEASPHRLLRPWRLPVPTGAAATQCDCGLLEVRVRPGPLQARSSQVAIAH